MTAPTKRMGAVECRSGSLSRMSEEVVCMLLARGNASPDHADQPGESPLSRAASSGHEGSSRRCCWKGMASIPKKLGPNMARKCFWDCQE